MGRLNLVIYLFLQCTFVLSDPTIEFDILCEERSFTVQYKVPDTKTNVLKRDVHVTLLDASCNSTNTSTLHDGTERSSYGIIGNFIELNITANYSECATKIDNTTDRIILNNTAVLKLTDYLRSGLTKRVYYYQYDISCQLGRYLNVTTENSNYTVDYSVINITTTYNRTEEFTIDFSLDFYTDNTFNTPHPPGAITVNTNEFIYAKIKEDTINDNFKFVVNQCAASPTSTYNPTTADIFFETGCRLDPTFDRLGQDNANHSFSFQIQAFSYIQEQLAVYFHCKIYICRTESDSANCRQQCQSNGARQRRDVTQANENDGQVSDTMVTSRLITFNKQRGCNDITCPSNSKCYPLQPAKCICDEDYVFSRVEKKCVKVRIVQIQNIHLDQVWNENYADNTHPDFLKLASKYEDILWKSFLATEATRVIEGIRIIRALPGSIIFETKIIYAPTSTPQTAYKAFVQSITSKSLPSTTVRRELQLLTDRTPAIVEIQAKMADIQKLTLIIIVVVLLLVVLMAGIVIFAIRRNRRRSMKDDVSGFDNAGIEISKYN